MKANSVAIDIESDGKEIYQLGYATDTGSRLFAKSKTSFLNEIEETESVARTKSHWIVGHNIIAWDLPVLRKRKKTCFRQSVLWDTLLLSWILAPWKSSHALINREQAHRADSDSKAALDLFYQQIDQFPTDTVMMLAGKALDPIEYLFSHAEVLSEMIRRDYPETPNYLKTMNTQERLVIIPHWRLAECAWCPTITYVWPEYYDNEDDFFINLEALEHLARRDKNVWTNALAIVVRDAEANNVRVLLRMIPRWLRDKVLGKLRDGKCLTNNNLIIPQNINVSTYYAYRNHDAETLGRAFSSKAEDYLFREEGQFDLLPESIALDNHDVTKILGIAAPHSSTLFSLDDLSLARQFISEEKINKKRIWLTYDPANSRIAEASCWRLYQQICFPSQQETEDNSDKFIIDQDKPTAIFPAWTITQHGKNRVFKDFIPPTSFNRLQYWEDALSRFLSLESNQDFEGIYILLVSHPHEKDALMAALSDYGATIPFEGVPLRHLERLRRGKYRFSVDIIEVADQWLLASESLDCEIQLVIESLPIYDWWICDSPATDDTTPFLTDESEEDPTEDSEDEDFDSNQDMGTGTGFVNTTKQQEVNKHPNHITPVILSQDAVRICIERFLKPWMSKTLKGHIPTNSPLILDCRFDKFNFSKSAHFTRRDFVIATLTACCFLNYSSQKWGNIFRID